MSRFDDELVKTAENAYQERGLSGQFTTPRQQPYDQVNTVGTDSAPGVTQAPAPAEEAGDWIANQPAAHVVDVRDLDAADQGEIIGGPGSSAVYAEGGPVYASVNPIDESLYNVYKASRDIRTAIDEQTDFDFSNLMTASTDAATVLRFASTDDNAKQVIGTVASIVQDIENDLATTGDYKQAAKDLTELESLLKEVKKAATGDSDEESDDDSDDSKTASKKDDDCTCDGEGTCKSCKKAKKTKKKQKKASNGNQESLAVIDVRDLDDQAGLFDRQRVMTPDHVTNPLVPEKVNGEDAAYVPFYNDGAESGVTPQVDHDRNAWPYDGTNPALVGYAGTVAAVQASREKIFEALQVVERLEKLGMVNHDDRAKHIAKFEQISDASLTGFKTALDAFEESGARQPRSQKVASGNNRMPEMGRLTTASTVTRQDVQSDDWLMTL